MDSWMGARIPRYFVKHFNFYLYSFELARSFVKTFFCLLAGITTGARDITVSLVVTHCPLLDSSPWYVSSPLHVRIGGCDDNEYMQVWGYWGSVPTDIPASHPLILGFNEPDHENQVKFINQQMMMIVNTGQHEPRESPGRMADVTRGLS